MFARVRSNSNDLDQAASGSRFALKAATAEAHERIDATYSAFDLSTLAGYAAFLTAQSAAFIPVEDALEQAGAEALVPGWTARRRASALRRDLAALGLAVPPVGSAPAFATEAAVLGGLYVLEGSRLGGAVLLRSVAPGLPKAFLAPENQSAWRAFTSMLDERLSSRGEIETATAAAISVFDAFERSARTTLEQIG